MASSRADALFFEENQYHVFFQRKNFNPLNIPQCAQSDIWGLAYIILFFYFSCKQVKA